MLLGLLHDLQKKYDFRTQVKELLYDLRITMYGKRAIYEMSMPEMSPSDRLRDWLVAGLEKPGKTNTGLAKRLGIPQPRVAEMKVGKRLIKTTEIAIISDYIGEPVPVEILPQENQQLVPVVGYVGAGYEIFSIDDFEKGGGIDFVEAPPGGVSKSTVALLVRGDSMAPMYKSDDTIFYDNIANGDLTHLIGRDCVVRLKDGRTFVKTLQRSGGQYWLQSHNADPIVGVEIEWAAKVLWVKKA